MKRHIEREMKKPCDLYLGKGLWRILEHNKKSHSFKISINNKTHYICSRCTGTYIGIVFGLVISLPYLLYDIPFILSGEMAFVGAWLMALPSIVDWSTSKLGLRNTNNKVRALTGILLGIGIIVYFWIGLPLIYIILSLLIFKAIIMITVNTKYLLNIGLKGFDIIRYQKSILKRIYLSVKYKLNPTLLTTMLHDESGDIVIDDTCLELGCLCLCCCCCCSCLLS